MRWIALAIVLFIAGYTYLTLHYRKAGRAYEPYEDIEQRRSLAHAGYERILVKIALPADPAPVPNHAAAAAGSLAAPPDLAAHLLQPPHLPAEVRFLAAEPDWNSSHAYVFQFVCLAADQRQELADVHLYRKGSDLWVMPECEPLSPGLEARSRACLVRVTIPSRSLEPGSYRLALLSRLGSLAWPVQVH